MRPRILIVGVVVGIAGIILLVVPIPTTYPSHTFYSNPKAEWGQNVSAPTVPGGLNQRIQFTVTWTTTGNETSAAADEWKVFDCGYVSKCPDSVFSGYPMLVGRGATGSLTWSAGPGELFNLAPGALEPGNLTVVASYTEPLEGGLVGSGVIVGGTAVALAGFALPVRTPKKIDPDPNAPGGSE
jgi:hypothetical protein